MSTPRYDEITKRTQDNCRPERAEKLLKLLEGIRPQFEKAPASSSKTRHNAEEGGLIDHILEVHNHLVKLAAPYEAAFPEALAKEKLWTVSLLHDIRKACDAAGTPYYVDNVLLSGKVSKDKPFKTNSGYLKEEGTDIYRGDIPAAMRQTFVLANYLRQLPDGACSLAFIQIKSPDLFTEIQEDERQAILWHDGGYGDAKYSANGKEGILSILTHAADMLASRWQRISAPEKAEDPAS